MKRFTFFPSFSFIFPYTFRKNHCVGSQIFRSITFHTFSSLHTLLCERATHTSPVEPSSCAIYPIEESDTYSHIHVNTKAHYYSPIHQPAKITILSRTHTRSIASQSLPPPLSLLFPPSLNPKPSHPPFLFSIEPPT